MTNTPPDTGNTIGVLRRREIEARIVAPLLDALGAEFGRDDVLRVARETIMQGAPCCDFRYRLRKPAEE
jgi:hypothetical protein